jgi:hypothetical protein
MRERRHRAERRGPERREPVPVIEEDGAHAEHERRLPRGHDGPEDAVVVCRRGRPEIERRPTPYEQPYAFGDGLQQLADPIARAGDHVERDERARAGEPARDGELVRAFERRELRTRSIGRRLGDARAARAGDEHSATRGGPDLEQAAAREPGGGASVRVLSHPGRRCRMAVVAGSRARPGSARAARAARSSGRRAARAAGGTATEASARNRRGARTT